MAAPIPSGVPGSPLPAGTDAALLAVRQATWQALSRILQPGAIITARVVEPVGGNSWLLALRGTTLIAESAIPLTPDSTVQIAVESAGDQPRLRLLGQTATAPVLAGAAPAAVLARLGLPDTAATRAALAAFQDRGAPLEAPRVQAAAQAMQSAPAAAQATIATAHADLAARGLPATPLSVAWAVRAQTPSPAQPALVAAAVAAQELPLPLTTVTAGAGPFSATPGSPRLSGTAATAPAIPASLAASFSAPALRAALAVVARLGDVAALPDPGVGGRAAASEALTLAGLRPRAESTVPGFTKPDHAPTGTHSSGTTAPSTRSAREADPPGSVTALARVSASTGGEALRPALIEHAAGTVLPPADLADYDLVLPLPLQDRGAPVPARLAVTTRTTAGGISATWLRVDAELQALGPVSIRLSGQGGTVAVHIVATGPGVAAVQAQAAAMTTALTDLGLLASVRVSDLSDSHREIGPDA